MLTALLGMLLQRRDPLTISDLGIGTGVEEDGHDLLVAPRSVAENHRLKQSCPAELLTWSTSISVRTTRRTYPT
jgi:hypothetical protein